MLNEQDKQYLIDTYFGGDIEKIGNDVAEYHHKRKLWDDLFLSTEVRGQKVIGSDLFTFMGYIPAIYFSLDQERFISGLFERYEAGEIDSNQMFELTDGITKQLRNKDMREHSVYSYNRNIYHQYFNHLPHLAEAAQQRLEYFLAGYEVVFESCVMAELILRDAINEGKLKFHPDRNNFIDTRAVTIAKYRAMLYYRGLDAANATECDAGTFIMEKFMERREAEQS